jgi:hypothetical protein
LRFSKMYELEAREGEFIDRLDRLNIKDRIIRSNDYNTIISTITKNPLKI